ncbi:MAG: DUF302 domain-containing protein [Spirochaetaceae bacterium]|nr:MAG: DUF302 domain-containing protein [Spirochaetaceae bacterium]
MMVERESSYDFETSVAMLEESIAANGWKLPTVHDLQGTMARYGYDVLGVKVFEICHPDHAEKILSQDDERIVSSMMPCRISIYEKSDGKTYVSTMNTGLIGKLFGGLIAEVMGVASAESEQIASVLFE